MITHHHHEPVTPPRVVVLGASGFVAGDLVQHLGELGMETLGVPSSRVDLRSPEAARKLGEILGPEDTLVFVSALTPDRGRDIRTLMANLSMAEHVCGVLEEKPCAHLVYVSSDAVYTDDANPVRESSPCDPSSFHGLMHLARERMLLHTAKIKGVRLLILRPSLLYGARDTHNGYGPNRFLRQALQDETIKLFGEGEEKRDHIYIRDLSRLIALCLQHGSSGTLNVATGVSTSFREVAEAAARLTGGDVRVEGTPRQNPIIHRHFDPTNTIKALPSFQYTSLAAGLAATLEELRTLRTQVG